MHFISITNRPVKRFNLKIIVGVRVARPNRCEKALRVSQVEKIRNIGLAVLSALLVFTAGVFLDFIRATRGYYEAPASEMVDAIVVLTGGKGRAEEGLSLLRQGKAGLLILSGVNEDADAGSIFFYSRLSAEESESIVLDKRSRSTYENAAEVSGMIRERGIRSIVLITSGYHMKRADFIFRHVVSPDVNIYNYVAPTPNFDVNRWWAGGSLALVMVEFLKYLWYCFSLGIL